MIFASLKMFAAAGIATVMMAGSALAVPVFSSSNSIWGGQKVGDTFLIGGQGTTRDPNSWPAAEGPAHAIDGVAQKYLNFGKENSGLVVTASEAFVVDSLQLWTANDHEGRDPGSYALYGTNTALVGGMGNTFDMNLFNLISSGSLALPMVRNLKGLNALNDAASATVNFANLSAFKSYMLLFPTIRNASENSVQIAEVQLYGETPSAVPVPAAGLLLLGSLFAFGFARRRA